MIKGLHIRANRAESTGLSPASDPKPKGKEHKTCTQNAICYEKCEAASQEGLEIPLMHQEAEYCENYEKVTT